ALRAAHPEILLEIAVSNAMANLTRREADVAVSPIPEPPETLVGRWIANIAHAVYGSSTYLSRYGGGDPSNFEWVGLDDALATTVIGRWIRDNVRDAQIGLRVDALPGLEGRSVRRHGRGAPALLPGRRRRSIASRSGGCWSRRAFSTLAAHAQRP